MTVLQSSTAAIGIRLRKNYQQKHETKFDIIIIGASKGYDVFLAVVSRELETG